MIQIDISYVGCPEISPLDESAKFRKSKRNPFFIKTLFTRFGCSDLIQTHSRSILVIPAQRAGFIYPIKETIPFWHGYGFTRFSVRLLDGTYYTRRVWEPNAPGRFVGSPLFWRGPDRCGNPHAG